MKFCISENPKKIAEYKRECATWASAMYPSNKDLKADKTQLLRRCRGYER